MYTVILAKIFSWYNLQIYLQLCGSGATNMTVIF